MRTIIFSNQKGGVGKTTTCRELGVYLGLQGKKILYIDLDPQGNLTNGLIDNDNKNGVFEVLTGGEYKFKKINENLHILSGDNRLTALSKSLVGEIDAYTRLRDILEDEKFNVYDYIFIDSRPAFDTLTINGLSACSDIIIPMSPGEYTLQGTNDLLKSIGMIKKNYNPRINILGVVINAYDTRPQITREIKEEIKDFFKEKVFSITISRTSKVEQAISEKVGILQMKNTSGLKIKREITLIGEELLNRLEG